MAGCEKWCMMRNPRDAKYGIDNLTEARVALIERNETLHRLAILSERFRQAAATQVSMNDKVHGTQQPRRPKYIW